MLREVSRILARLKGERFMGGLIAKAVWRRGGAMKEAEGLTVLRDRKDTVIACGRIGDTSLILTMLLGRFDPKDLEKEIAATRAEAAKETRDETLAWRPWHTFTAGEVAEFVNAVNDVNTIHQGENPVVPGLLILEQLLKTPEYRDAANLTLKFIRPAFAWEALFLAETGKGKFTIRGEAALAEGAVK